MRRVRAVAFAALVMASGAVSLTMPAASAATQTGYPPGACSPTTGSVDLGTFDVGRRVVFTLSPTCVFTAGAAVRVTVNGIDIPGKVADAGGSVVVDVTIVSATQLSVDDPTLVPGRCGVNTIVATGPSAVARGTVTQTGTFTVVCPSAPVAAATQGRLSFTGANVGALVVAALALLGIGWFLVATSRRRRANAGVAG